MNTTPGPWTVTESTCAFCRKNGMSEFSVQGPPAGYHAPFTNQSDARLVAAAPELLAALKAAQYGIDGLCPECAYDHHHEHSASCSLAKAIAKAEAE